MRKTHQLIQQVYNIDKNKIEELKQVLIIAMQSGKQIPKMSEIEDKVRDNITIFNVSKKSVFTGFFIVL